MPEVIRGLIDPFASGESLKGCDNNMHHLHYLTPESSEKPISALSESSLASTRLRCAPVLRVAKALNWHVTYGEKIQGLPTVLIIGKIGASDIHIRSHQWIEKISALQKTVKVFLDYTDHHIGSPSPMTYFYQATLKMVDGYIVPSLSMAKLLKQSWGGTVSIIEDPLEVSCLIPKEGSNKPITLLWFGHSSNIDFLIGFLQNGLHDGDYIRLIILSNESGINYFVNHQIISPAKIEFNIGLWSLENMIQAAKVADGCIIPSNLQDSKKIGVSSNRLITALALGLSTAADNLPSYEEFSSYYCDIRSQGFRKFLGNPCKSRELVIQAQSKLIPRFKMEKIEQDWKNFLIALIA